MVSLRELAIELRAQIYSAHFKGVLAGLSLRRQRLAYDSLCGVHLLNDDEPTPKLRASGEISATIVPTSEPALEPAFVITTMYIKVLIDEP